MMDVQMLKYTDRCPVEVPIAPALHKPAQTPMNAPKI